MIVNRLFRRRHSSSIIRHHLGSGVLFSVELKFPRRQRKMAALPPTVILYSVADNSSWHFVSFAGTSFPIHEIYEFSKRRARFLALKDSFSTKCSCASNIGFDGNRLIDEANFAITLTCRPSFFREHQNYGYVLLYLCSD